MRISDWSSDVCSSDPPRLLLGRVGGDRADHPAPRHRRNAVRAHVVALHVDCDRLGKRGHPPLGGGIVRLPERPDQRSEEHTSELQSLMRISYAVFCLIKKSDHKYLLL